MNFSLQELNKKGFLFFSYNKEKIRFLSNVDQITFFTNFIKEICSIEGEQLYHDYDLLHQNEEIKPHYHVIPGSFQVVIWLPDTDFKGRNFLFGTQQKLEQVKPEKGYLCFMKPNDPTFIHGVSLLESKTPIKTLGFSSLSKQVIGNQDIFIQNFKLSKKVLSIDSLSL